MYLQMVAIKTCGRRVCKIEFSLFNYSTREVLFEQVFI